MISKYTLFTVACLLVVCIIFSGAHEALAESFVFKRNLSFGTVGQDVKELQKFLNANNFLLAKLGFGSLGKETSFFGPLTKAALIKFQKAKKIIPSVGFFGPKTRAFINNYNLWPTSPLGPIIPEPSNPSLNTANMFSIGGTITGLSSPVTLQNNNSDDVTIRPGDDSAFSFSTKIANGSNYSVTIKGDTSPHRCYLKDSSGVINGADITNVRIACGTDLFFNPFMFVSGSSGSGSSATAFSCGDNLIDTRDSQSYRTVLVGSQCWMADNLNFGTRIDGVNNQASADDGTAQKYCYNDDPAKCETDGGLYQWHTAMAFSPVCDNHLNTSPCIVSGVTKGICPSGWHVPTLLELQTAARVSDPGCDINCDSGLCNCSTAGLKMKADLAHLPIAWDGTNIYNLSIIPSGIRASNGSFSRYGVSVNLWAGNVLGGNDGQYAWFTSFFGTGNEFAVPPDAIYGGLNFRTYGYSLRCVKN